MNIRSIILIVRSIENTHLLQSRGFAINLINANMNNWRITITTHDGLLRIFDLDITNGIIRPNNISTDIIWYNHFTKRSETSSHGVCIDEIAHKGFVNSIIKYGVMEFVMNLIENMNDTNLIRGRRIGVKGN